MRSITDPSNHRGQSGGVAIVVTDAWSRPADATPYAQYDRIAADTNDTGTTPLRSVAIARVPGGSGYITFWEIVTNLTTFLAQIRVHLYTVAQPPTAMPGDNGAFAGKFANSLKRVGQIDLPTMALPGATGSDLVRAYRDDIRLPFQCADGDTNIYYAYEITGSGLTPASGQTFNQKIKADAD